MWGLLVRRVAPVLAAAVAIAALAALVVPAAPAGAATSAQASATARAARASGGPTARAARVGAAPAGEPLQLVFPLVADTAGLQRFAQAVTTPGSPEHGHYRSLSWLAARFGATAARRGRVVSYLRRVGAGRIRVDATHLFVDAVLSAGRAERLFATHLARFHAARAAGVFTAPVAPAHLPRALRGAVTGVVGLDTRAVAHQPLASTPSSGVPSAYAPASGTPAGCSAGVASGGFTPNQYLTAYGISPLQAAGATGQGERVALIEIDGFKDTDIASFARCFGLRVPSINAFGVGINHSLPPGPEATLDLEVLDAAAPGLRSIDLYESSTRSADVLQALTAPLGNRGFKPQVISVSLGLCEPDTAASVGASGLAAAESALQMAAASGITVLAASGDDGSADCVSGSSVSSEPIPWLQVNYPASSPWTTAVGGTNLVLNPDNSIAAQSVWNDGATTATPAAGGGGFSRIFRRPTYQRGTVTPDKRAVPDVALLADIYPGYDVYCSASPECVNGSNSSPWQTVGGTSAATPLLAGGFAIIDELLRTHGRQSLGLANPLLYAAGRNAALAPSVFTDVVAGNNDVGPFISGYNRPLGCCSAAAGFDEASGWGGVNLRQFGALALRAVPKIVGITLSLPRGQHPVRAHHLLARVSCSGSCLFRVAARVTIGRRRPFTDYSTPFRLARRGSRTVRVPFSRGQLRALQAALRHHVRITAQLLGAILDAGGNVEKRTSVRTLRITS